MTDIYPQLASHADITDLGPYINDSEWVLEQKLDGHRIMLVLNQTMKPTALTRNGTLYSRKMPKAVDEFRMPAKGEWVLDGELVDGVFWVFDLPVCPILNDDAPLELRRVTLESLLTTLASRSDIPPHPFRIVPQARTKDEKINLATTALTDDYEGLVLKHKKAPYRSAGRTEEWLKVKFVTTCDVIVTDVRGDGKDSVGYGVLDENGQLMDLGRASLIGKEKAGAIAPGDVIEVRYLYVGANGRLYQPTIVKKRTDKLPHECNAMQLKYVNKRVLEAL